MVPDVGSTRLLIMRSVVVLPHIDGPTRAVTVPSGRSRLSSWTASERAPGNRFETATRRRADTGRTVAPGCTKCPMSDLREEDVGLEPMVEVDRWIAAAA